MQIHRQHGTVASIAPETTFTGEVSISGYSRRDAPSRMTTATVTFPPGARTSWKTHPAGQTLVVLDGSGRAQSRGGPVVEIGAGDVVWCPPGVPHWDGAAPGGPLTLVALHEGEVEFGDEVTAEQYDA